MPVDKNLCETSMSHIVYNDPLMCTIKAQTLVIFLFYCEAYFLPSTHVKSTFCHIPTQYVNR